MPAGKASGVAGGGERPVVMIDGSAVNLVHGRALDQTKSDYLKTDNTKRTRPEGGTYDSNAKTG